MDTSQKTDTKASLIAELSVVQKTTIAVVSGIVAFIFAGVDLAVNVGAVRIDVPWVIVLPLLISMVYGSRYGLVAGLTGGALYPFTLWANNGYANVLTAVLLLALFTIMGLHRADDTSMKYSKVIVRLAIIVLPFIIFQAVLFLLALNPLLSLNPAFWQSDYITHFDTQIITSFIIKDSINVLLLSLSAEVLARLPFIRKILHLPIPPEMRYNNRIFVLAVSNTLVLIGAFALLDGTLLSGIEHMRKEYYTITFMILLWGGIIVARVIIGFAEQRLAVELALRKSELRFVHVAASAEDWIWEIDTDGNYTYCSEACKNITGYSSDEIVGHFRFFELFEPGSRESLSAHFFHRFRAGETIKRQPNPILNKTGEIIFLETAGVPIVGADNVVVGYRGVHRDITEQRQNEERLRKSEEKFRSAFEISPDAININRVSDGTYVTVNQGFTRISGYTKEDVIGKTSLEIDIWVNPADRLGLVEGLQKNGTFENLEAEFRCKDGSVIIGLMSSAIIEINDEKHLINITRDITARKKAEEEITVFSRAVEQSPACIFITDHTGRIKYVNSKAAEITGYSREEFLHQKPHIGSITGLTKDIYQDMIDTINAGSDWRGEFRNKRKNGEVYWEDLSVSPIKDASGTLTHFLAIMEDITHRKALDKKLLDAKIQAENANKLKDAFIANISHEIRTPLNGIIGMSSIIESIFSAKASDDEKQFFTSITISANRLKSTIDMILNFSRLQVGEYPISPSRISLSGILRDLMNEYKPVAFEKSLNMQFNNTLIDDHVFADPTSIQNAFSNIVDNAVKFSNKGTIAINLFVNQNQEKTVEFRDNGIGISPDYIGHLFEPYTQEQSGFGRGYEGVGLGLSITKRLLDLNNAYVTVDSKQGEGSVFTVSFKLTDSESAKNELQQKHFPEENVLSFKPSRFVKPLVLVVEDDDINQLYMKSVLESEYEVLQADHAESALALFNKFPVEMILMDISLKKEIDGFELTKIIRTGDRNKHVPIIAVTGHAFQEDKQRAFTAGCSDYLAKPFRSAELKEKMQKYI